jgi:RNA polymerase sigma factor (sigma-70 family)
VPETDRGGDPFKLCAVAVSLAWPAVTRSGTDTRRPRDDRERAIGGSAKTENPRDGGHSVWRDGRECASVTNDSTTAAQVERDVIPLLEPLYRHARRMTSEHADAKDLLHEAILKACAAVESLRPGTNLKAWLCPIMTNTYINGYRKKQRQPAQHPTQQVTDRQLVASAACQPAAPDWFAQSPGSPPSVCTPEKSVRDQMIFSNDDLG